MRLPAPIPDRDCGACTACCVELGIDDPQLHKPDHTACPHMLARQGCAIHDVRPATCRNWYCGWRFMPLSDAMRPDHANVMLVPELGADPDKGGLRIVLLNDDRAALLRDELLTLIAKSVRGGVPIFLSWGHGVFAKRALVNPATQLAVANGDKAQFVAILQGLLDEMAQQVAVEIIAAGGRPGMQS